MVAGSAAHLHLNHPIIRSRRADGSPDCQMTLRFPLLAGAERVIERGSVELALRNREHSSMISQSSRLCARCGCGNLALSASQRLIHCSSLPQRLPIRVRQEVWTASQRRGCTTPPPSANSGVMAMRAPPELQFIGARRCICLCYIAVLHICSAGWRHR